MRLRTRTRSGRRSPKTAKHLREHARRRALERFGVSLTTAEIDDITKAIQKGRAEFFDRQSGTVTRWIVLLRETKVAVAYDKKRKVIRTVMPVEYLSSSAHQTWVETIIAKED